MLVGKGIWTLYDDVALAVQKADDVGANAILCKVSKRGKYDPTAARQALQKVSKNPTLLPVAWTYNYLDDPQAEAECIIKALQDGFVAFILDVESDTRGKFAAAKSLVQIAFSLGVDASRVYLCSDPRLTARIDEFPLQELAPLCRGGFMPMAYAEIVPSTTPKAAEKVVGDAYAEYARWQASLGYLQHPLLPALSSYWDNAGKARMTLAELRDWMNEVQNRQASFVSLYRAGVTTAEAWRAFKALSTTSPVKFFQSQVPAVVIAPQQAGYAEFEYDAGVLGQMKQLVDKEGRLVRYLRTSTVQTCYVQYEPNLSIAGEYVVEAFIPGTHATTRNARYFVNHHPTDQHGTAVQSEIALRQIDYSDIWVPLGIFWCDPAQPESGRVNVVDVTSDDRQREIAFGALRWQYRTPLAPGFDAPIGSPAERAGTQVWPPNWVDANEFGKKYGLGYHTGADLNLPQDADRGLPVYAAADGVVTFAQAVGGAWRTLIVIQHAPLPDGTPVFSRYAHVDIQIQAGQTVQRGQQIAKIGLFPGSTTIKPNYHLHFDISRTTILQHNPQHWPGDDLNALHQHYVEPAAFIREHRPA